MNRQPIALPAYEKLAEEYARLAETKPHNALYDRPNTLSLVSDPRGQRVLDVGCGPGIYAQQLLARGAKVTGLDVSPAMLAQAQRKTRRLVQANFAEPLPFANASFDGVLSALAVHYVADWPAMFREFHRVLRAPGWLVFSTDHPCFSFVRAGGEKYFATELTGETWRANGEKIYVPHYRRPLEEVINTLLGAGFQLDKLLEPKPTEEFRRVAPEVYERLLKAPDFLCIRAVKR